MDNKIIYFNYIFRFSGGEEKRFDIRLDSATLNMLQPQRDEYPEWTKLSFHKCPGCSLNEAEQKYCPIATGIIDIIDCFKSHPSYEEIDVSVETEARTYSKHTALQKGLSPMIGIFMVTTGCPVMEKLKPMVRFHLPFATEEETRYRAISMYLFAQYFIYKQGNRSSEGPDWDLKGLGRIYEEIRIVNKSFSQRLANIKIEDASINALIILDCFADFVKFSITKDALEDIKTLFNSYLKS
jgi:hypothetical protein